MQNKNMFTNEKTWLQATVWLIIDLVRFSNTSDNDSAVENKSHDNNTSVQIDYPKEESKSQDREMVNIEPSQEAENPESFFHAIESSQQYNTNSLNYNVSHYFNWLDIQK